MGNSGALSENPGPLSVIYGWAICLREVLRIHVGNSTRLPLRRMNDSLSRDSNSVTLNSGDQSLCSATTLDAYDS
jgi:hypothetical protein